MAVTINSGSSPTLAVLQADLLKLAEILKRGQYPASVITPGCIDHIVNIGKDAGTTLSVS